MYAYTFDHLNIESLNEGLVAIDDILLTSFWFSASASSSCNSICPGEDTRPAWGTQWMGPKARDTDEGFLLKELALSLKILEHFRFLAASKSKWSEKKAIRRFQQPTTKKTYLSKKDSEVSWIFRGGPQCPAAYAPGRSKVSTYLLKKLVQNPGGLPCATCREWLTYLPVNPENPRERYIVVGRHEVQISEGRLWFVINFLP